MQHSIEVLEMVSAIRRHAIKNYAKGGWDYVVECYEDNDIIDVIEGARTIKGAIRKMAREIGPIAEYRDDIQGETSR